MPKICEFAAHMGPVNCLKIGRRSHGVLATGGEDKMVNLWAIGRSAAILSLAGHQSPVECVTYDHAEMNVAAGGHNGTIKLWDLQSGKVTRTLTGHRASCRALDFHRDGHFLVSGSLDTNAKVWDTRQRECIRTVKGHARAVEQTTISPDGQMLATACEGGAVKLWDFATGRLLADLRGHEHRVSSLAFHPHEFMLASASHDRSVRLWDLETWDLVGTAGGDALPVRAVVFQPQGTHLMAATQDGFKVWATEPLQHCSTVTMDWGRVADVTTSDHRLVACSFAGSMVSTHTVDLRTVPPWGSRPAGGSARPASAHAPQGDPGTAGGAAGSRRVSRQSSGKAWPPEPPPPPAQLPPPVHSPGPKQPPLAAAGEPLPLGPLRQQLARNRLAPGELQPPQPTRVEVVSTATDMQGGSLLRAAASTAEPSSGAAGRSVVSTATDVPGESLLRRPAPGQAPGAAAPAGMAQPASRAPAARLPPSRHGNHFPPVEVYAPAGAPLQHAGGAATGGRTTGSSRASAASSAQPSRRNSEQELGTAGGRASSRGSSRATTPPSARQERCGGGEAAAALAQPRPTAPAAAQPPPQQQAEQQQAEAVPAPRDPILDAAAARPRVAGELSALLGALQVARGLVARGSVEGACRAVAARGDAGAANMLLSALKGHPGVFTLGAVQPTVRLLDALLASGHPAHADTALDALALVLRGPGQVIRETCAAPAGIGVDLTLEERRERCTVARLALQGLTMRLHVLGRGEGVVASRAAQLAAELEALG